MTFFVDANIVVYAAVDSPYRDACLEVLRAVAGGADGRTSTAVLEEVWHIELSGRAGPLEGLARQAYAIFTPLLPVNDAIVRNALALPDSPLGANDRIHASTCTHHEIGAIITADSDFDHAQGLRRVDPLDAGALPRLLRP